MTKVFFKAAAFFAVLALIFGVILPFLISAKSTLAVIGGIIVLVCFVGGLVYTLERSLRNEKSGK